MKICENCLHVDVCSLHEDNFMADAIKTAFAENSKTMSITYTALARLEMLSLIKRVIF